MSENPQKLSDQISEKIHSETSEKGKNHGPNAENRKEKSQKIQENGIWNFFINRRPISWLLTLGIVLMGLFSVNTIPKEVQPEINIPIGTVTVALPGANPSDVESLITDKLEKEIQNISDIKNLDSNSNLGFASIIVEFDAKADLDEKIQQLKDKVDIAKTEFPDDATDPLVLKAEANSASVVNFSLIGERNFTELTKVAEDIEAELEQVAGVSDVKIVGQQEKEIQVLVDQQKAENYGLNINLISNLISGNDINFPIGIITTDKVNYSIRIDNQFKNLDDIRNIPLIQIPGETNTTIFIRDLAEVKEVPKQQEIISKLSNNGQESKQTITLQVFKKDGGSIIEIVDSAKTKIKELQENNEVPNDIEISASSDNSEFIRQDLGRLLKSGQQTTVLIIFILFLALGLVEGILAGISIPLALLASIIILKIQGLTINSLTLFSLVIALGLMVDTAIVIMEGIFENMRNGLSSKDAAKASVQTYRWPLIAGTMTTVFAFFPMLLVSGILGEFLRTLPLTISAALLSSLFLSLTIIPAFAAKFLKNKKITKEKKASILAPIFDRIGPWFERRIVNILKSVWKKIIVVGLSIIALIASFSLPGSGLLKVEMFPQTDFRFFEIGIELPKGVVLEETKKVAQDIEAYLYEIPEVENFLTIIGSGDSQNQTDVVSVSSGGSSNLANITVTLVPAEERVRKSFEVGDELRKKIEQYTKADVRVIEFSEGPPSDAPITVRLTGENFETLEQISNDIQAMIREIPGTQNVRDSLTAGLNEFQFTLDQEKLNIHGLSAFEVSATIRNVLLGTKATEINIDDEDLDVLVKYDIPSQDNTPEISIEEIEKFEIPTPRGYSVNLGQIAELKFDQGLSSIAHSDSDRIVKVRSDLDQNTNVTEATAILEEKLKDYDIPNGYGVRIGGDTEDIDQSFQELFQSMIVALILVAMTLVLVFNSLKQPFIILLSLPLALIGVFPGLYLIGLALSFPAFLGVVALSGVVVNDAIVLIDRINSNRREGMEFHAAIAEASNARLQPIIMTTITTIVGILPLSLTDDFWAGLGFSLIFGLLFATVLTLIVIPVLYYAFEYFKAKKAGEITKF